MISLKLVIAISGLHGTGKSTYAKALAHEFGLRHLSAGTIFRQIAREREVSLEELSRLAEINGRIDHIIDERTKEAAKRGSVVLEGHLAGWMAKDYADVKIFLTAPEAIRMERISKRENISVRDARNQTLRVERIERRRWKKIYRINITDLSIYDVILNTSLLPLDSAIKILKEIVRGYISKQAGGQR